jgi:hypothetical protein
MAGLPWAQFGEAKIRKAIDRDHADEVAMYLNDEERAWLDWLFDGPPQCDGIDCEYCGMPIPDDYDMRFVELRVPLIDLARVA